LLSNVKLEMFVGTIFRSRQPCLGQERAMLIAFPSLFFLLHIILPYSKLLINYL